MGHFYGALCLIDREDADGRPLLTSDGRATWTGGYPELVYERGAKGSGELITFPTGKITDLGSVPRLGWSFVPPDGPGSKIFPIHDFLYATCGDGMWMGRRYITRATAYTRLEADDILREGLADLGVGLVTRNLIHRAVRVGGAAAWGS